MEWLRLYVEVLDDEKIAKMSDGTYRIFTYLMLVAREKDQNGAIPMELKDIAWRLRRPAAQIKKAIEHLIELEILSNENGVLQFINWHKRQYKSDNVNDRVKRYREKKETLHETLENRTEQNRTDIQGENKNNCNVPHAEVIELYHRLLPDLPRVQIWSKKRKSYLESRWKEDVDRQSLAWWEDYFGIVSKSPFLLGKAEQRNGDKSFKADLEWLILPNNLPKVLEGRYLENRPKGSW